MWPSGLQDSITKTEESRTISNLLPLGRNTYFSFVKIKDNFKVFNLENFNDFLIPQQARSHDGDSPIPTE